MSDGLKLMLASCCDDVCTTPECMCAERIDAAIAAAEARGEERMRERAVKVTSIEVDAFSEKAATANVGARIGWQMAMGAAAIVRQRIRALSLSTPEKQTEAAPASNGEAG